MNRHISPFRARNNTIRNLIIIAVAFLIVAAAVFGIVRAVNNYKEAKYLENYGAAALHVGGYTVTYDVYRYFYLSYKDELENNYADDERSLDNAVRARVAKAVQGMYGAIALAADYGMSTDDADVKIAATQYIDSVKKYYSENELDYEEELADNYMTERVFDFLMRTDSLEDLLFDKLLSDGVVENDDAEILKLINGDEFVRVKQIFIENDKKENTDDNRKIAEEALAEYKRGTDMDRLIELYSEDTDMPTDGYYFTRLEMISEFEDAAFALADGEVSDVVESDTGFHILFRLPKSEQYITENFDDLKSQYQNSAFYRMVNKRAAVLTVTEDDYVRRLSAEEIK